MRKAGRWGSFLGRRYWAEMQGMRRRQAGKSRGERIPGEGTANARAMRRIRKKATASGRQK